MSCFEIGFDAGSCYGSVSRCAPLQCYLYVIRTVVQSGVKKAVFGVMFDSSYRLMSKRWFRVSERGSYFYAHASTVTFCSSVKFSENDACYPPDDVIDYFRQAPSGVCA